MPKSRAATGGWRTIPSLCTTKLYERRELKSSLDEYEKT
jgi:hypothetical protein